MLLHISEITLPLNDPVLKFFVILAIILFAPIILNKFRIPSILGLIIAGAVIGPNGINLMERDSSIILSGAAGLLYIMFLAGLEIDMADFKKNSTKSLLFGVGTFIVAMILGIFVSIYVLHFSVMTSVLLASMFASHTLIAYPIISKYGIVKNRAVTISVGGTVITDTLSLLTLAIIAGMTTGEVDSAFWLRMFLSIIIFASIIIFLFPIIARWFLKRFKDNVSQYIFILGMVFLGAVLAQLAGIEGIIGAFLTGLSLNRLIPSSSSLNNRIEFVGNAIFIPFFLIGVGMLIDYRVLFHGWETIEVAAAMIITAMIAKYIVAWLTQKALKYTIDERRVIFGLINAHAAAALAAVTVGYNIIIGETPDGLPIRLFNESILNGAILMILVTCTIASFVAQKGARNISLAESMSKNNDDKTFKENILIPVKHPENIDELINLSLLIKRKKNKNGIYAVNVIYNQDSEPNADKRAHRILEKAQITASAADIRLNTILRYDVSIANAIISVIKENKITDMILGLHEKKELSESFLGNLTQHILENSNVTTYIYKPLQPIATIKRHIIIIPENAETEFGFPFWVVKMWNLAMNTGCRLSFYGTKETISIIQDIHKENYIEADFNLFEDWDDFEAISQSMHSDDNLVIVMSRKNKASYQLGMKKVPYYVNEYFSTNSLIMIYPMQLADNENKNRDLLNASLLTNINKFGGVSKAISKILRSR